MMLCKKLREVPSVATEWQQTTWCPDCEYYDRGTCSNSTRTASNAPCPFDGNALPLREAAVDPNHDQPRRPLDTALCLEPPSQPQFTALEKAIKYQIVQRTGGRIQMLEVEAINGGVVIRGCAPCFYLKQLALQGVFDVIGSASAIRVELNVLVPPTMSGANA